MRNDPPRRPSPSSRAAAAPREPAAGLAITIMPAKPVLGAEQTEQFRTVDADGNDLEGAKWSLRDAEGGDIVGSIDATTGLYTAAKRVTAQRVVVVSATTESGQSDTAVVVLVPGRVTITPNEATLRAGEVQLFQAHVSGDPTAEVTWAASPTVGELSPGGEYRAPAAIRHDRTVIIAARSKLSREPGQARVTLVADPWTGWGPHALGCWLLVLCVVPLLVYSLWPPPVDRTKLHDAVGAQATATRARSQLVLVLEEEQRRAADLSAQLSAAEKTPAPGAPAPAGRSLQELRDDKKRADERVQERSGEVRQAQRELTEKTEKATLEQVTLDRAMRDEQRLLLLIALAGALGSFVHTTRSFVDFVGNRRLQPSWTWWYILQPATGSALAVVVYLVIRGGLFAGAASDLNPFGFVAVASLVGLFAKQATSKLDEVFSTIFRSDKERELKDKLDPGANRTQTSGEAGGRPAAP